MSGGNRNEATRKLVRAAACVALSAVAIAISNFTPARIVPLVLASLGVYVAFRKSGALYGVLTALAAIVLAFVIGGLTSTFFFTVIFFIPYAIFEVLIRPLTYKTTWQAATRILASAAFVAAACTAVIFIADAATGTSIAALAGKIGYAGAIAAVTVAALPLDLFFNYVAELVVARIK